MTDEFKGVSIAPLTTYLRFMERGDGALLRVKGF